MAKFAQSHRRHELFFCLLLLMIGCVFARNYTYEELLPCSLNTLQLAQLQQNDYVEPCIIFDVSPNQFTAVETNKSAIISIVQVTPSNCGNHRDGAVTAIKSLNSDNGGKGIALGYSEDFYVSFHFVSVVVGNPASMSEDEYKDRHTQILKSMLIALDAPYIVGTCSFAADIEKEPARDHQAIVMSQVGPPGFYTDENPYVFGFHINSDTYPLPAVQSLGFLAAETEQGPSGIPVRVIYRTKSEFFYSTCRSAIDKLKQSGFTDLKEILYDHSTDHDGDGEINQFDADFLISLADEACPPGSGENEGFHPALFACTLTEHDIIINRWMENGCRPISTWITASTWGWANDNLNMVPYYQGGGQWHEAFDYSDKYFESGRELLLHNQGLFGYLGNYDQVVSYAIPILYAQHLVSIYKVADNPDPIGDFHDDDEREHIRRGMIILNVPTLFGQVAFNEYKRNIGRGAAGTQWLPLNPGGSFMNALVSPFLQAQAGTTIPSPSALPCNAGMFLNETMRQITGSLLASACTKCPVDTFTKSPSQRSECELCPEGSSTEGLDGQEYCIMRNDNLIPTGILAFGYIASSASYILSICFILWLIYNRMDPVVKVSQIEFLLLICIGTLVSSSTVIALGFQAGTGEDTSIASIGCAAAPFLYAIGWVLQYSSLSAKTYRLYIIMQNNNQLKRVKVTAFQMLRIVLAALAVDLAILICWVIVSPLEYVRSEESTSIDEENGIITISTVGRCASSTDEIGFWGFAGPLIGFHVLLVLFTNILLFKVREVGDRYQEQKYVGMASMLMFEILAVGIPVLVSVKDNPTAMYIVLTGIVALDDIGILCCIFVPKVRFQIKGLEEGVAFGESIMRESHKRASTREYARRESSFILPTSSQFQVSKPSDPSDYSTAEEERNLRRRDSFTARIGGVGKSPFAKLDGSRGSAGDSLVSGSILEETSDDLRFHESDGDSSSSRSIGRNVPLLTSNPADLAADIRAKKRSLENQASGINQSTHGVSDQPSFINISAIRRPSGVPIDQVSMLQTTQKLMEEHERMMRATEEIMQEHQRLKDRLEEAQNWRMMLELSTSERDKNVGLSASERSNGDDYAKSERTVLASNTSETNNDERFPDRNSKDAQSIKTTTTQSLAYTTDASNNLADTVAPLPNVRGELESEKGNDHSKDIRSEIIADTEDESSNSSNGAAKVDRQNEG